MPIVIPGTNDFHTFGTLTDAINTRPFVPTGVSELPWNAQGLQGRTAIIDRRADGVDLIDEKPYGVPGSQVVVDDGEPLTLYVPHYPHNFTLRPDEVRERRLFGSEYAYEMPQDKLDRLLSKWRRDIDYTNEFLRVGTLFGKVRDRLGNVRRDLTAADKFNERPFVYAFPFADGTKNFYRFIGQVKRRAEDALGDFKINGWRAIAASEMHDKVVYHKSVYDAYKFWDSSPILRADNTKAPFSVSTDVSLQYYRNSVIPKSNGNRVFPVNAMVLVADADGLLQTRYSPRTDMRNVNEFGLPMYVSPEDLKHGQGVEVEGEMNVMNYVKRYRGGVVIIVDSADADAIAYYSPTGDANGLDTVQY